jgi:hypothetical protein
MARRNPAGGGKAGGQARFFPARHVAPASGGPATVEDLLQITGVGQARLERYGRQFFEVIRAFWEDHPGAEDNDLAESQDEVLASASAQPAHIPTYVEKAREQHARAYTKWSDEEDQSLRQAWESQKDAPESNAARIRAISDDFDRKPGAIRSRLKKLGLIEA